MTERERDVGGETRTSASLERICETSKSRLDQHWAFSPSSSQMKGPLTSGSSSSPSSRRTVPPNQERSAFCSKKERVSTSRTHHANPRLSHPLRERLPRLHMVHMQFRSKLVSSRSVGESALRLRDPVACFETRRKARSSSDEVTKRSVRIGEG